MNDVRTSGDSEEAMRFLRWFRPGGPWTLTAIGVDRQSIETATFGEDSVVALLDWLAGRNGKDNLYFMVNPAIRRLTKKARKEDVESLAWLHVDCDPPKGADLKSSQAEILTRLQAFEPKPNAIIFSGGGYQAFWRLDEPLYVGGDPRVMSG